MNTSKKILSVFTKKFSLNYIYFGSLFFALIAIHLFHLKLTNSGSAFSRFYFGLHVFIQCFLEVFLLCLVGGWICSVFKRWVSYVFSLLVLLLFVAHLLDFPLVRFMDISVWFVIDFIADESYQNFLEMLYSTNISLSSWMLLGISVIGIIIGGVGFFKWCEKISSKRPLFFSFQQGMKPLFIASGFFLVGDVTCNGRLSEQCYQKLSMVLPWKTTLFPPNLPSLDASLFFQEPPSGQEINERLSSIKPSRNPDIFIFVVESLREDFLDEKTAPNLNQFSKDHISFLEGISSSNATQTSWFSLFYSRRPFSWAKYQPSVWKKGSIPLQILKNMGYKIHLVSSARLEFYRMDEVIFGENRYLADSFTEFPHIKSREAFESDAQVFAEIKKLALQDQNSGGRVFIAFLDSTHFDYSWPKETMTFFKPISEINFFKAIWSVDDLEIIKNRYRNAIFYVDSLFGNFFYELKQKKHWNDSVVVITGDHGEEFYEYGHLFHASTLSHPQIRVPLYYKFGSESLPGRKKGALTSHVDVFPSIFHYLVGKNDLHQWFEGRSILDAPSPFVIATRFNASRSPFEFLMYNGSYQILARFENIRNIFESKKIKILSTQNQKGELLPFNSELIEREFSLAFEEVFRNE